jgi:hypothetical protein
MDHESWIKLLANIIAAGKIQRLPARTPWPMHAALAFLYDEAGRRGLRARAGLEMTFVPSPEVGCRAAGADAALRALARRRLLREQGSLLAAELQVDMDEAIQCRRSLLAMDPAVVALYQRAGERWAALASTCSKYSDSSDVAPLAIVVSGIA